MNYTVKELRGGQYNLLILTDVKEKKFLMKQKILLYRFSMNRSNLQLQVMDIKKFNDDLNSGKEYANQIMSNSMIWYDKGLVSFKYPGERVN